MVLGQADRPLAPSAPRRRAPARGRARRGASRGACGRTRTRPHRPGWSRSRARRHSSARAQRIRRCPTVRRGSCWPSAISSSTTWRADPSRRHSTKTRSIACRTCSSGHSTIRPSSSRSSPTGSASRSSPRAALLRSPPSRRARIRCSSASDIVPFRPEQQPVVELARRVHAVGVGDQRPGQRAQIQQLMPVRRRARQPRDLQRQDQPDMPEPDLGDQLLEPEPPVARGARAAECPHRPPRPTRPASRARPRARAAHTGAPRDSTLRSTCASVDWRTYTTARRRRCASVILPRSLIALGLHQPRQQPRQPHRHLALALRRQRLPHRRRHHRSSLTASASCPDIDHLRFRRRLRRRRGRRARTRSSRSANNRHAAGDAEHAQRPAPARRRRGRSVQRAGIVPDAAVDQPAPQHQLAALGPPAQHLQLDAAQLARRRDQPHPLRQRINNMSSSTPTRPAPARRTWRSRSAIRACLAGHRVAFRTATEWVALPRRRPTPRPPRRRTRRAAALSRC